MQKQLIHNKTLSHLAGIEPATFRLTAERANQLRHKCYTIHNASTKSAEPSWIIHTITQKVNPSRKRVKTFLNKHCCGMLANSTYYGTII